MKNNIITAHTNNSTSYGRGLYTIFSGELEAEIQTYSYKIGCLPEIIWKPILIKWVGIRATERGASYIIKDITGAKYYTITAFRVLSRRRGKISLKKYLNIKKLSEIKEEEEEK
jgi:hypothetical protein